MDAATIRALSKHTGGTFAPVLGDVHVYENAAGQLRAQISNGRYWIDVPSTGPAMTVNAERLAAALAACKGEPTLNVTATGVTVKDSRVRARIATAEREYPRTDPDPPGALELPGILDTLRALQPFAATDASRPWSTCVCLSGQWAYATNNVCVARSPLPVTIVTPINVPSTVIDAVAERGPVTTIGYTGQSITFYYEDGSWVRSLLVSGQWPTETVDGMLDTIGGAWTETHPDLAGMLDTAARMATDKHPSVKFHDGGFSLTDDSFTVDDVQPVPEAGAVGARMAATVFGVASRVQWHTPKQDTHAFRCGDLVGVFAGVRA